MSLCRNNFAVSPFFESLYCLFVCLESVVAMQIPEENNAGHTALEVKKNEH